MRNTFLLSLSLGASLLLVGCSGGDSGDVTYALNNELNETITSDGEYYVIHSSSFSTDSESTMTQEYAIKPVDPDAKENIYTYDNSDGYLVTYFLHKSDAGFDQYMEIVQPEIDSGFDVLDQDDTVLVSGYLSDEHLEAIGFISDEYLQTYDFQDDLLIVNDYLEYSVISDAD